MSYEIPVYSAEAECGLAERIVAGASIAYEVPVEPASPELAAAMRGRALSVAGIEPVVDDDLFFLRDILVSVAWNLNDDVFVRDEVWAARHTSDDKPFNFAHDQADIIGHIVGSQAVDADLAPIADDTPADKLPERFHIVNGSVIYRHIGTAERKALIEQTIAEIKAGEWKVSMECFLRGFDYAVKDGDEPARLVARSADTAWMTKYLRAYPPDPKRPIADAHAGTGTFVDPGTGRELRVGRVPRNITFCGKGLVRKAANPESVILDTASVVYEEATKSSEVSELKDKEIIMSDPTAEVLSLRDQLSTANDAIASLRTENDGLRNKDVEKTIAGLTADVEAKAKQVDALTAQVATLTEASAKLAGRAESAEASLKEAADKLAVVAAEKAAAARLATVVDKGADKEQAEKLVASLAALGDEAFAATLEVVAASFAKKAEPKVDEARVIAEAKPEADASLAVAEEGREAAIATISDFLSASVLATPRRGRGSN